MKISLIILSLAILVSCGDKTVSFSEPNLFKTWLCKFEGSAATGEITVPLVGLQYDVEESFDETICDQTNPCFTLNVHAIFYRNGTAVILPSSNGGLVSYVLNDTTLRIIDPSGQPGFGDLVCVEAL